MSDKPQFFLNYPWLQTFKVVYGEHVPATINLNHCIVATPDGEDRTTCLIHGGGLVTLAIPHAEFNRLIWLDHRQ